MNSLQDGCTETFENKAEFSREYQVVQQSCKVWIRIMFFLSGFSQYSNLYHHIRIQIPSTLFFSVSIERNKIIKKNTYLSKCIKRKKLKTYLSGPIRIRLFPEHLVRFFSSSRESDQYLDLVNFNQYPNFGGKARWILEISI